MTDREQPGRTSPPATRPTRAQRLVAAGFLGAFALTVVTVLLTGLAVRAPSKGAATGPVEAPASAPKAESGGFDAAASDAARRPDAQPRGARRPDTQPPPAPGADEDSAGARAPENGRAGAPR